MITLSDCAYHLSMSITRFIRGILRGVRYAKSLRVLFLHRRSPSWTNLVLYSRVVFIFNEPTISVKCNTVLYIKSTIQNIFFYHFCLQRRLFYLEMIIFPHPCTQRLLFHPPSPPPPHPLPFGPNCFSQVGGGGNIAMLPAGVSHLLSPSKSFRAKFGYLRQACRQLFMTNSWCTHVGRTCVPATRTCYVSDFSSNISMPLPMD